jgi:hypothetical protein
MQVVQSLERELSAVESDLKRLQGSRYQLEVCFALHAVQLFAHMFSLPSPQADIQDKRHALQLDAECLRVRFGLGEQPIE